MYVYCMVSLERSFRQVYDGGFRITIYTYITTPTPPPTTATELWAKTSYPFHMYMYIYSAIVNVIYFTAEDLDITVRN